MRDDLKRYSLSKGTVRFTAEHPLTYDVDERLLRERLAEIRGG